MKRHSDRYRLLCIDPGKMTGVAELDITDRENPKIIFSDEMAISDFHHFIEMHISQYSDVLEVVIENYFITANTAKLSPQPWSLHLIGVVIFLCDKYNVPLKIQPPSDKQFADDTKLEKLGWHHTGGAGHAHDAFRHGLVWLINKYPPFAKAFLK